MAKPRLIIVVRHAQSEGNKKREIHQTVPDHRVKLTPEGVAQARDAGRRLRNLLRPDDTLHFFTSPYRRTRETTEGILETLTSDDPAPSPFRRSNIKVYEEPRLREQDFGNFQPCSDEMERMWQERADYGHFFYRIPNGESAADAYDRVSGFNESLWRQFGEDSFASVCVLVTHGLMSRVFLMKWYHFSVEYFEDLRNVNHCEFLIMRKQDNGKYLLENNLRTWSQLRRDRAAKDGKDGVAPAPAPGRIERSRTITIPRRWGGCPNGCDHSRHYKLREDLELLRQKDVEHALAGVGSSGTAVAASASASQTIITTVATTSAARTGSSPSTTARRSRLLRTISSDDEDYDDDGDDDDDRSGEDNPATKAPAKPAFSSLDPARMRAIQVDEPLSSPEVILQHPRHLHVGRDFGGTYSGNASAAGSDTDPPSDDDRRRRRRLAPQEARARAKAASTLRRQTPTGDDGDGDTSAHEQYHQPHPPTRLGDMPPVDGGAEGDVDADFPEDIDKAEKEDRSLAGSVY